MTKEEVKKKFPDFKWTCDNFIENNLSGENNPSHSSKVDYAERQKRTPFSIEFYRKKYDSEEKAQKAYDELDIDKYKILATLDKRTSEICQKLDGEVFNVKDAVIGVNMPPFH